jgi:hypothetical protein
MAIDERPSNVERRSERARAARARSEEKQSKEGREDCVAQNPARRSRAAPHANTVRSISQYSPHARIAAEQV